MLPLRARVDEGAMTTTPSDCLVSYPGHSLVGGSYPSAEKQSVYSTASFDWANFTLDTYLKMLSVKQGGMKYQFLSL